MIIKLKYVFLILFITIIVFNWNYIRYVFAGMRNINKSLIASMSYATIIVFCRRNILLLPVNPFIKELEKNMKLELDCPKWSIFVEDNIWHVLSTTGRLCDVHLRLSNCQSMGSTTLGKWGRRWGIKSNNFSKCSKAQ